MKYLVYLSLFFAAGFSFAQQGNTQPRVLLNALMLSPVDDSQVIGGHNDPNNGYFFRLTGPASCEILSTVYVVNGETYETPGYFLSPKAVKLLQGAKTAELLVKSVTAKVDGQVITIPLNRSVYFATKEELIQYSCNKALL